MRRSKDPVTATGEEVILVDPSLFTQPYDARLDRGLKAAGLVTTWLTRPSRPGEENELPLADRRIDFYRWSESRRGPGGRLRGPMKGLEHVLGMARLVLAVRRRRLLVVHLQWAVVPVIDAVVMRILRRFCPVVLTVHDTNPFNGEHVSVLQNWGFDRPIAAADAVIVHTAAARDRLVSRGIDAGRIRIVPHGPFELAGAPRAPRDRESDPRWTFTLFGQIKPYKGLDVLIEALGRMDSAIRERCRVIVAGAAHMDVEPLIERAKALGLVSTIELRIGRLSEQEMVDLFEESDSFVMPYREIDASGVYFLIKSLGKWIVASRVGIFADDIEDGRTGRLVAPADPALLAEALTEATTRRPVPEAARRGLGWTEIGAATKAIYQSLVAARGKGAA